MELPDFHDDAGLVDPGFVSALTRLKRLDLTGTGVRDLSPPAGSAALRRLDDGEPCSDPFDFRRLVCLAEDADGPEGEPDGAGRLGA